MAQENPSSCLNISNNIDNFLDKSSNIKSVVPVVNFVVTVVEKDAVRYGRGALGCSRGAGYRRGVA